MSAHPCPCGCGIEVPQHMLSCRRSWYSLPKNLRNQIWNAYNSGDTGRHAELITEAVDLIKPKSQTPGTVGTAADVKVTEMLAAGELDPDDMKTIEETRDRLEQEMP